MRHRQLTIVSVLALCAGIAHAEVEITLKNDFIEAHKNRATIVAAFTVDKAHPKPNSPAKDGDLHIAGRGPEIQLPAVAEIMNAADFPNTVRAVHDAEGTGNPITIRGAWRLWCEHASAPQVQGAPLPAFTTTNPDHVFEIHPAITIGNQNVIESLRPIQGFTPKDAETAFLTYENKKCQIIPGAETTTIVTPMAGYNYVEFVMQAYGDDQFVVPDGRFVYANVLDLQGNILAYKRRMVFIQDSAPEQKVKGLTKGQCLHVLGIPRINLALVAWRARNGSEKPEILTWSLPYEIVIVAVYADSGCGLE